MYQKLVSYIPFAWHLMPNRGRSAFHNQQQVLFHQYSFVPLPPMSDIHAQFITCYLLYHTH